MLKDYNSDDESESKSQVTSDCISSLSSQFLSSDSDVYSRRSPTFHRKMTKQINDSESNSSEGKNTATLESVSEGEESVSQSDDEDDTFKPNHLLVPANKSRRSSLFQL